MVSSQSALLLALATSLPLSLLQNAKRARFASPLFSTTSALFFRSLAKSENLTALFSIACALLHKNTGVYPPFPVLFHSLTFRCGHRFLTRLGYSLRRSTGEPPTGFGAASSRLQWQRLFLFPHGPRRPKDFCIGWSACFANVSAFWPRPRKKPSTICASRSAAAVRSHASSRKSILTPPGGRSAKPAANFSAASAKFAIVTFRN